jgi:inositol oxygenase
MNKLRNYQNASNNIKQFYKTNRSKQTLQYIQSMILKYCSSFSTKMHIWKIAEHLNKLVDISDPDLTLPNIIHAFQSAEYAKECGEPDWMIFTCFIHDFGKIIYLFEDHENGISSKEQWGIVGDTFIIGTELPDQLIYPEFNYLNPDKDLRLYEDGCGIDKCFVSFGHDEYLWRVLQNIDHKLPDEALYIIRYHSLYALHKEEQYVDLMNDYDRKMLPYLKRFNKYDLYSKCDKEYNLDNMKKYYINLAKKFGCEYMNVL